jgi:2-aminoadipate transaminase
LDLSVSPEEILITNGSQQCLDLLGKVFIDRGDHVAIERPGYLGAIQAYSLYEPVFHPVSLNDDGPDPLKLADVLEKRPVKLFYGVPNSQNPSGITYTNARRRELATIIGNTNTLFVEDDAYGELNFSGKTLPSMREFLPDQTIITGSFSKILAPGMRLGGVVAPPDVMEQLVIAKQASDLHSNYLSQRIAYQYLQQQNIDDYIRKICTVYAMPPHDRYDQGKISRIGTLHRAGGRDVHLVNAAGWNIIDTGIRRRPQRGCCCPSGHPILYRRRRR